jgi:hypothetical protein
MPATVGNVVQGKAVRTTWAFARCVLLLCTALGLAMMHTLGHAGLEHQTTHSASTATIGMAAGNQLAVGSTGGCHDPCDETPGGHGGPMGAWQICLAVLSGLTIVVLLIALMFARGPSQQWVRRAGSHYSGPQRSPPRPFALAVATVSTLRI